MRKLLIWQLSNMAHIEFCGETSNEVVAKHGPPENMNTDQGSHLIGLAWITALTDAGARISMGDGVVVAVIVAAWWNGRYEGRKILDSAR